MGSVVSSLDYVYMENAEGESLTSMTVCEGRTVTGTTVRRRFSSEDTWKKMETVRRGVSDRHNGHAGWTVVGMTVRRTCPFEDTYKNGERPLETGSLTTRTVCARCVRWRTLRKNGQWGVRAFGTDLTMVRRGYNGPSSGSRSVDQWQNWRTPFNPDEPTSNL